MICREGAEGTARYSRLVAVSASRPTLSASTARAISSVVEHLLHTQGVAGSKPASRTPVSCRDELWNE